MFVSKEPGQNSSHHYPRAVLLADLLRGFTGLLVCTALIFIVQPADWLVFVLAAFVALFGGYLFRVFNRCRCRIEMDSGSLRVFASAKSDTARTRLDWNELDRLDLDYFCTRRDGRDGWLQLRLRAGDRSVRLDSRLLGFERVLAQAVAVARSCGVALSAATAGNLQAIGFEDDLEDRSAADGDDGDNDGVDEDRIGSLDGKRGGDMSGQMNAGTLDGTR